MRSANCCGPWRSWPARRARRARRGRHLFRPVRKKRGGEGDRSPAHGRPDEGARQARGAMSRSRQTAMPAIPPRAARLGRAACRSRRRSARFMQPTSRQIRTTASAIGPVPNFIGRCGMASARTAISIRPCPMRPIADDAGRCRCDLCLSDDPRADEGREQEERTQAFRSTFARSLTFWNLVNLPGEKPARFARVY